MNKKITVLSAEMEQDKMLLNVEENISLKNVSAKEQMLVDSDQFAFVYILEIDEQYTYLNLPEEIWPKLKEGLEKSMSLYLFNQKEQLGLPMFNEELSYLIENIKGNSNYGEEMVAKVEETF
jgi:hypothetical protein